ATVNPFISAFFILLNFSGRLFYIISTNSKPCFDWQFSIGQRQCFFCCRHRYTTSLKQYCSWLNHGYPIFGSTFTFTHTYLSWLASNWLIWENTNPHLTFTLHRASYSNTSCF